MTSKILITGASGLLGSTLVPLAQSQRHDVVALHHSTEAIGKTTFLSVDLTQSTEVDKILETTQPDCILHCAAATDVERCETEKEWAHALNVKATSHLAQWAKQNKAYLVYISTDSVFNGRKGHYEESDAPDPLNWYARTKLGGEESVRSAGGEHLIVRTNLFGWGVGSKLSLAEWVLKGLLKNESFSTFTDVRFNPLFTENLSQLLLDFVTRRAQGTYHVAAQSPCSKHEFAEFISQEFHLPAHLKPVSVDSVKFKAQRPKDTSLNVQKASFFLKKPLPTVREEIASFRSKLDQGRVNRAQKPWLTPTVQTS